MISRAAVLLVFLTITFSASAASWNDNSHYVSVGSSNGYYIVKPGSPLFRQLGLYEAPIVDTAHPFRHGYGADALAFRFNRSGVLIAPPAYIAQAQANNFYKGRLGSFTRGHSTTRDVEALFGKGHRRAERPDGFMWYYELPVYNAFEDWGGRR